MAMQVTSALIQRHRPRLGSPATYRFLFSAAGYRGRCSTTTTDAWWRASCRMAHANAPACSGGTGRSALARSTGESPRYRRRVMTPRLRLLAAAVAGGVAIVAGDAAPAQKSRG